MCVGAAGVTRSLGALSACGLPVRTRPARAETYDDDSPLARGHHGVEGGRCKVQTLERRLAQLGLDVADRLVCETGFRVAACLTALQARGATVLGLDPNAEGAAPQAR